MFILNNSKTELYNSILMQNNNQTLFMTCLIMILKTIFIAKNKKFDFISMYTAFKTITLRRKKISDI